MNLKTFHKELNKKRASNEMRGAMPIYFAIHPKSLQDLKIDCIQKDSTVWSKYDPVTKIMGVTAIENARINPGEIHFF